MADARLPRVLKLPLPFTHSERVLDALAAVAPRPDAAVTPSVRVNVVTAGLPRAWLALKPPPHASTLPSPPLESRSTVTFTPPPLASITAPFGTTAASTRGWVAFPG